MISTSTSFSSDFLVVIFDHFKIRIQSISFGGGGVHRIFYLDINYQKFENKKDGVKLIIKVT